MTLDNPSVLAIGAHPDDIEFVMAGTLFLLKDAGWDVHYMNIARGDCGSTVEDNEATAHRRRGEAIEACAILGATFHSSICNDLEIFYTPELVRKVLAVVRTVRPRIVLTHSTEDYMEDHTNAARLAVTAAFARGIPNYASLPPVGPCLDDVTVYHAMPHGLSTPLRRKIRPGLYVDVSSVMDRKREMLAAHRSQKEWLDASQGLDSYLQTMEDFGAEVGRLSGRFSRAEGWRRHLHYGFSAQESDPLSKVLAERALVDQVTEKALDAGMEPLG
jgi:N-acetylglucosamine malate deacetylase 1